MAEIATPLFCAHKSMALKTCCSAAEVLFVSALRDICSQRLRILCSRCTCILPSVILLRSSLMRLARVLQAFDRGEMTNWSPANSAMATIAPITNNC